MLSIGRHFVLVALLALLLVFELKNINIQAIIPLGSVWQLLIAFLVCVLALTGKINKISRNGFVFLLLLTLFFIWALGVSLKSDEPRLSLQRIILLVAVTYPLAISLLCVDDPKRIIVGYLKVMLLIIFLISALALIVNFFGVLKVGNSYSFKSLTLGPISFEQAVMGRFFRTGGYFGNSNTISKWLVFFFPFLLMLYHVREITKTQLVIVLFVFSLMLFTALSRAGMVLAILSVFIYIYLYSKSFKKKFLLMALAAIFSFSLLTLYLHYFGDTSRGSLDLNSRDETWSVLLQSAKNNPLTGIGFGVSREVVLDPHNIDFAAHNFYIEKLVEVGGVGLFFGLLPFVFTAFFSYKNIKRSKTNSQRSLFAAVTAFYISFFLYLNVETGLFVFSIWHIFIIIISSITLNLIKTVNEKNSSHHHRP